MFSSEA